MKQKRMYKIRRLALLLAMAVGLCGCLAGCGAKKTSVESATIRIGALKGPTSMGLLYLIDDENINKSGIHYEFQMATGADELLPLMVKGELDIALVPANVAAILYSKTNGGVCMIDINTKGVLYLVSGDASCQGIADLKDRTVYLTGKGTTPDYVLRYLLAENGIAEGECKLEYKSEATEVAAVLAEDPGAIGLLPQPFVTAALVQNDALSVVLDIGEQWRGLQGQEMVTGVTVVRKEFLEQNEQAVKAFLEDHAASAKAINDDPATGATYAVREGIVAKEPIAQKAIPACNITCITGQSMKDAAEFYLGVLYGQSPESVGGSLPADDFYFVP